MGEAEASALGLLTKTKLGALLRPQHVTLIKDNASVDQTLRVSGGARAGGVGGQSGRAGGVEWWPHPSDWAPVGTTTRH